MIKFGWCLVWPGTPHRNCPRKVFSRGTRKLYICECPCHRENDEALEELI